MTCTEMQLTSSKLKPYSGDLLYLGWGWKGGGTDRHLIYRLIKILFYNEEDKKSEAHNGKVFF